MGEYNFDKLKSINRAIRRGHIGYDYRIYPSRPFNNKANTCTGGKHSRKNNQIKKEIYTYLSKYGKSINY
jgi:hypothetical protein